ncbi:glycosyl transferase [Aliikangiella marina]|uniref:Glycosyl transferase n=1 Tax=Aliikangiella marina TaxID=1712262 RepID=A0A545T573_9GAMM|nr:fused MFS/spermidine synthase [Aliikangiella marina]TQV72322.1 glycosyl transferase [Aliikangiella marina]
MKKATILLLAFSAGFSIMCFQLLGGRMLAPYFGSSVYVWGSIITVFMLALSIGYLSGGKFSLYKPNLIRYGGIFVSAALTLLPTIFFSESIFEFVFQRIEDPRYGSLVASTLIFLVPSIIMGMIAPYSVRILTVSADSSGHTAGFLYFVSTMGSAIGTILTSFYLVLWLEVNQILWLTFSTLFIAGCLAWIVSSIDKNAAQPSVA